MYVPPLALLLLTAAALLAGAALWRRGHRRLRGRRRGFVELAAAYRPFLRGLGLTEAGQFLSLEGSVVSGHADRDVTRLTLGTGPGAVTVYLKRERHVSRAVRLRSLFAGFGLASRSVREARTLQALQREGLAAPEWLAAGEDGRGRAFLVVRAVAGAALCDFLRAGPDVPRRRRAARAVGRELARLHDAGFTHPDLYAQHVLVDPAGERVWFLDWQRSRRGRRVGRAARRHDLAILHATLADDLAAPRERLACLRAYLPPRPNAARKRRPRARLLKALVAAVAARAARLRARRRHVAEKARSAVPPQRQEWSCVEGAALCVTPELTAAWPGRPPAWLSLDRQPDPPAGAVSRRWLAPPGGGRALLVRRKGWPSDSGGWPFGRPGVSPEERLASLLFRLQRHAVPAPRVLAMGQRPSAGGADSFLLTAADDDAVRLDVWLARQRGRARLAVRRNVLRGAGAVLHRLHGASCYFARGGAAAALAVRPAPGGPLVVLTRPDLVEARRSPAPGRARRDLAELARALAGDGCGRTDLLRLRRGYEEDPAGRYRTDVASRRPAAPHRLAGEAPPEAPRRDGLLLRLLRGTRWLRQRPAWVRHAGPAWADGVMDVAVTDRFQAKQGRSTGRLVLPAPGGAPPLVVYLKRHYRIPLWQRLLATAWPRGGWSPAMREWRHLEWARAQGVPVPEALAAAEFIGPACRLRSFLAVRELADMLPLNEALPIAAARLDPGAFRRWKRTLAAELARLARLLHDRRCFHKDFYFCHLYVARADTAGVPRGGWKGRVCVIDLHRLSHHRLTWWRWQTKDLAQLLYSSEIPGVGARDRLAFWKAYRDAGPRPAAERWLFRWVLFKWARYRRHDVRNKARAQAARARQAG